LGVESLFTENLERFELIAQATADVIWDWNLVEDRIWRSEGTDAFFPRNLSPRQASEERWFQCIVETDRERVRLAFRELLAGFATRGHLSYRATRRDGVVVDCIEHLLLLRDEDNEPVRVIGCIRDATEQKRLEAQLMRAQRLETVGRVAGGIAHDLNNILTPISMALDVLKLDQRDPDERQVIDNLRSSVSHGASLLQQLLIFARGAESKKELLDLRKVSREVCKIARETFPSSIRLLEEMPGTLPPLLGNHTQLRQVLFNLLFNARDAMQDGGVIQVRARIREASAEPSNKLVLQAPHLELIVEDNGPGIESAHLEKIWDPFFSTKEEGKGTGLGLSTSLAIINEHGGHISVQSSGRGTVFNIYLPLAPKVGRTLADAQSEPVKARILFLDDDLARRTVACKVLEKRGYAVRAVPPGEGLECLTDPAQPFDLVIGNPLEAAGDLPSVLEQIRQVHPGIRVVATVSFLPSSGSLPPGVQGILLKPFTGPELIREVEEALQREKSSSLP
jgi:signal transduction histidine kinase/CheY-like chemotaxis protein